MMKWWLMAALTLTVSACALGLGGGSPVEYWSIGMAVEPDASAASVAEHINGANARVALVAGPRDAGWFAQVASQTGLTLSGPGLTGDRGLGFLTGLELLGDTSIVLGTESDSVHLHDALYRVDDDRTIDLMLARVPAGSDLERTTRTLLQYVATDVGPTAAIVLAVSAATPAAADSIDGLLRAAFSSTLECVGDESTRRGAFRVFYGPSARLRCEDARRIDGPTSPIVARLVVQGL